VVFCFWIVYCKFEFDYLFLDSRIQGCLPLYEEMMKF
jgi:hypothetical protein